MFNYLKWELKDYFSSRYKWFTFFILVFLLALIIPDISKGFIPSLVGYAFIIALIISIFGIYFAGTKHAVDTFSKKTFLLESMIPVPAKKILFAKYVLGVIINFIYLFLTIFGIIVIIIKGSGLENTFDTIKKIIDITDPVKLIDAICLLICSSVSFLSVVVLGFVWAKVINPAGKYEKLIGFIIAMFLLYTVGYILSSVLASSTSSFILDISYLIIATISFFITSYMVENKLEIYS